MNTVLITETSTGIVTISKLLPSDMVRKIIKKTMMK